MMQDDILNISAAPTFDNRITKVEVHTYNPYANAALGNNDEIRIPIHQQDLYILPCQSFLYVEGRLILSEGTAAADAVILDNNCVSFMFDEIRYELDGVEIDRSRNLGITTTLKNYLSLSTEKSKTLTNAGWIYEKGEDENEEVYKATLDFNFCVPLNILLGFCEDYKPVVINARHELILIRARVDTNALYCSGGSIVLKPAVELHKIQWRVSHVSLEELHKLYMLRILESGKSINISSVRGIFTNTLCYKQLRSIRGL